MVDRIEHSELHIAKPIYDLVNKQICPGTGIDPDQFWSKFAALISHFAPINRELLKNAKTFKRRSILGITSIAATLTSPTTRHFCKALVIWFPMVLILVLLRLTLTLRLLSRPAHSWWCRL